MDFLTWRSVRALGELQVLTRASYLALVIVPMLAALWPGIRLTVNRYNEAVADSTHALERSSERLRDDTERLRGVIARLSQRLPERSAAAGHADQIRTALAGID